MPHSVVVSLRLCRCHYKGRLASNNTVFDSSYERGRPLTFKVSLAQCLNDWVNPCMHSDYDWWSSRLSGNVSKSIARRYQTA